MSRDSSSENVEALQGDDPNPVEIIVGRDLLSQPVSRFPTPAESPIPPVLLGPAPPVTITERTNDHFEDDSYFELHAPGLSLDVSDSGYWEIFEGESTVPMAIIADDDSGWAASPAPLGHEALGPTARGGDAYLEVFREGRPDPISVTGENDRPNVVSRSPPDPYVEVFEGNSGLAIEFVKADGGVGSYEEFERLNVNPVHFIPDSNIDGRQFPLQGSGGSYYEVFVGDNRLPAPIQPEFVWHPPTFYFEEYDPETGVFRYEDYAGRPIAVPPFRGTHGRGTMYSGSFVGSDLVPQGIEPDPDSFYTEVFGSYPLWPADFLEDEGAWIDRLFDPNGLEGDVFDIVSPRVGVAALLFPNIEVDVQSFIEVFADDPFHPASILTDEDRNLSAAPAMAEPGDSSSRDEV
jgi:hypothetical protein